MIILVGNQKGGAGKSTLTVLFANYLAETQKRKVTVLDMDYQQSIASKAEKAKVLDNEPLYEVVPADIKLFPAMQRALSRKQQEIILIDLPGKMDDNGLIPIFAAASLVLCPFSYDEFSVDSTLLFAMVLRKINSKAPMVFIPNRVKNTVKYETKTEVEHVIQQFGSVTPVLSDRVDFQRINTFSIPLTIYPVILPVFDWIYQTHIAYEERKTHE